MADLQIFGQIAKVAPDQRRVFGFAKVSKIAGHLIEDLERDVITPEELESAAHDFMLAHLEESMEKARGGYGTTGHSTSAGPAPRTAEVIESVMITPDKLQLWGVPEDVAKGAHVGWWLGLQITDEATWQMVKDRRLRAFSIEGRGVRQEVA